MSKPSATFYLFHGDDDLSMDEAVAKLRAQMTGPNADLNTSEFDGESASVPEIVNSEDILSDVKEAAGGYGVAILRADVKDLIFPGNLQEIMNRVLTAERLSQAQLVEARTKAEVQRIEAQSKAEAARLQMTAQEELQRRTAESEAEVQRIKTQAEIRVLEERSQAAHAFGEHPALLRLVELETLRELARTANARLYVSFDRPNGAPSEKDDENE
jgi:regulator of protease activity HflC (stomatin/prohibitin superfamily)